MVRVGAADDPNLWNVSNPKIRDAIARATLRFCKETNRTTEMQIDAARDALRKELAAGMMGPENTVRELTRRVNGIFDSAEKWRAQRIAVTEASRAVHQAERMAAAESGVVKGFRWLLSDDACEICQEIAMENPVIGLEGTFAERGSGPYKNIETPPAHPHCMCTMTEELIPVEELEAAE
jgi:hypothetical protein